MIDKNKIKMKKFIVLFILCCTIIFAATSCQKEKVEINSRTFDAGKPFYVNGGFDSNEDERILMIDGNNKTLFLYLGECPNLLFVAKGDTIICPRELKDKYGSEIILQACVGDTAILDTTNYSEYKNIIQYRNIDSISCLVNINNEIVYKRLLLKQSDWKISAQKFLAAFGILVGVIWIIILIKNSRC